MMKGNILGGLGGLLGMGLLSGGAMRGGASLLGTLVGGLGRSAGGGCGRGSGRGSGRRGGCGSDGNALAEVLQQALQRLASSPPSAGIGAGAGAAALPQTQAEIIDVSALRKPETETAQKEALILLADSLSSHIPGRARVRHDGLRNHAAFTRLRQALLAAGFCDAVFSAATGSVLLTWDAEKWDTAEFFAAAAPLGEYLLACENGVA